MLDEVRKFGFVCIVGAGPGDPALLTLKAKNYLERADVVVYDRLVPTSILAFARPDAELIYAGKEPDGESVSQDWVNEVLISKALEGKFVVRLKNGDPFVFGRGAEEVEALVNSGIPYEIVPGVSSAFAVPAYAGIPLTDRRFSSSFVVTVGRNSPLNENGQRANLKQLAVADTVIVLMGVGEIEKVVRKLLEGGKSPQTLAAMIEWGTTSRQKVIATTLGELVHYAKAENIRPPSVLIVGDVVHLREKLAWYERKPLFGKCISLTCLDEGDQKIAQWFERLGAEVIRLPLLWTKRETSLRAKSNLDKNSLSGSDWLVFACPHSVEAFVKFAMSENIDLRTFAKMRFAAVEKRTAQALAKLCISPDAVIKRGDFTEFKAKVLDNGTNDQGVKKLLRFLVWHSCQTLTELVEQLRKLGEEVEEVAVGWGEFETATKDFLSLLLKEPVDTFVFTQPCAVYKLAKVTSLDQLTSRVSKFVAFGEDTAMALQQFGFIPDLVAETHNLEALLASNLASTLSTP